jgi:stage II sporulation protein AA (anti-sigma F factor antagonist)
MSTTTPSGTATVTHHDNDGTWLIAIEGEHDISTTPLLDEQTSGVWPRCKLAVVDLSQATFIDSSMINWLLRVRSALTATGRDALRIVHGPPGGVVERILDLTSLHDQVPCHPTRHDALAGTPNDPGTDRLPSGEAYALGEGPV